MSATIITFPPRAGALWPAVCMDIHTHDAGPIAPRVPMPINATALATKFTDHFLPVVWASIDLLKAHEQDFEVRCRGMLDAEGTAMLDELCTELQAVGQQMQILVDGLEVTRARLRTAMARLAPPAAS